MNINEKITLNKIESVLILSEIRKLINRVEELSSSLVKLEYIKSAYEVLDEKSQLKILVGLLMFRLNDFNDLFRGESEFLKVMNEFELHVEKTGFEEIYLITLFDAYYHFLRSNTRMIEEHKKSGLAEEVELFWQRRESYLFLIIRTAFINGMPNVENLIKAIFWLDQLFSEMKIFKLAAPTLLELLKRGQLKAVERFAIFMRNTDFIENFDVEAGKLSYIFALKKIGVSDELIKDFVELMKFEEDSL